MNHNISLALAIGGGLVGLVLLHALLSGQSAAASAITVGATLSSPFALMGDTSGSLVNNATVAPSTAVSSTGDGGTPATIPAVPDVTPAPPAGVPLAGWGSALAGMHDVAEGFSPALFLEGPR